MGWNMLLTLLLAVGPWQSAGVGQPNLLRNPSFEDDLRKSWKGYGFTMERYAVEAVDGSYSVKCTGRLVLLH